MASDHEPYEVPASGCGVGGLLDGGRWVATGCWGGGGSGGRHSLDGAAALGGLDCCGNHGGIVMVMGFEHSPLLSLMILRRFEKAPTVFLTSKSFSFSLLHKR